MRLYPIFHPAAALYTPRMLETLREDFARLPELLALPGRQPRADAEPASGGRRSETASRHGLGWTGRRSPGVGPTPAGGRRRTRRRRWINWLGLF